MAADFEKHRLLNHPDVSTESQKKPLSSLGEFRQRLCPSLRQHSCLPGNVCVHSKAALVILVWSVVVGAVYLGLLSSFGALSYFAQSSIKSPHSSLRFEIPIYMVVTAYAFLALVLLFYPFSGYLADIHCGRYKAVFRSLFLLWLGMIFFSAGIIIIMSHGYHELKQLKFSIPIGSFALVSVVLTIISLSCYQANIIQLGLDQLLEAPSQKLGLFLHWLMWSYTLGAFMTLLSIVFIPCYIEIDSITNRYSHAIGAVSLVFVLLITLLLTFTYYKRSWFYTEPPQSNPYKIVFKVLNFARKNKYPLRRSAFTYCDDFIPSRIDFAKERYGGPFTTEQVENVKIFLRIVSVLLALGPVFVLEVPGSYYLFPIFAVHIDKEVQFMKNKVCNSLTKWVLLQSEILGYISSIVFLPIYIWVVFSLLRKKIPKILTRLQIAVGMSLCGILSLLIIDLIGHFHYQHEHRSSSENMTENTCLFTSHFLYSSMQKDQPPNVLRLHWAAAIFPNIIMNLGSLLVSATSFEFISAQSPHSMKGLLVGVFFAVKGLFQFISAAAVVPFAIPSVWDNVSAVTNCGFGYYLFTIVVASGGLVVFSGVVWRYRYRQREERPFDTQYAENYFERYIGSVNRPTAALHSPSSEDLLYHSHLGITISGEDSSDSEDNDTSVSTREDSKMALKLPGTIGSRSKYM